MSDSTSLRFRGRSFLWRKVALQKSRAFRPLFWFLMPAPEKNFLKFIKSHSLKKSHSQLFQDFLPLYFLNNRTQGFFVEVGVGDGVSNSNSYVLEKHFGWSGILVEPNSFFLKSIKQNRNASFVNLAAGAKDGTAETLVSTDNGEYSYISNDYVGTGIRRESILDQSVVTKTLCSILRELKAPKIIDMLSIDVEGYELEVLKGIDFTEQIFQVVCIEHNYNAIKRAEIERIFVKNGYLKVLPYASQFDSFYVRAAAEN